MAIEIEIKIMIPHLAFPRPALAALAFLAALFATPNTAQAQVRMCNETSYVLHAAAAFRQGVASKTEGWFVLMPGSCETALEEMPEGARAFVYAHSARAHAGSGLVFDGSERFCIGDRASRFTIEGRRECRRRDYMEADFAPVAIGAGRPQVDFTERADYGRRRARMAGVQRMLTDLGYDIGEIDGFGGERTREATSAFKLRYRIDGNPTGEKLLRQLHNTANQVGGERGLILCNKTDHLVWAATGKVRDFGFESQGWLRVDAGACKQAVNNDLTERFYFYYAEAVTEKGQPVMEGGRQKIWTGDFALCAKPTRFQIIGNNDCADRGFDELLFRKVDAGNATKWRVNLE